MEKPHHQKKAYLFAFLSVICWSTVATAFKISLASIDYFQLLSWSTFVSSLVLFVVILIQRKTAVLIKISKSDFLWALVSGIFNPFLYYTILFKAYSVLPAQEAMVLNYAWPIVLVLLSVPLLKQKIHPKVFIALLICFIGIIIIVTKGAFTQFSFSDSKGDALAVGSSFIWAVFWIANMKNQADNIIKLFIAFLIGFILSVISNLAFSEILIPNFNTLCSVVYVGVFEMSVTFVFWMTALSYSSSTAKVSRFIYLSPFLSLVIIHFVLKEDIHWSSIVGLVLIILGIAFQESLSLKKPS